MAILLFVLKFQATIAQKEGQELIDSLFAELPKLTEDTNKVKTLAKLCLELSDFNLEKGVEIGNQALKLAEELEYDFGIAISKLSLSKEHGFLPFIYGNYWNLYLLQKDQGNIEQALFYLEQYTEYFWNRMKLTDESKAAALIWKYEKELKEKELDLLQIQNRKRLTIIIGGTIGVIILLLLTILLIIIWRKNRLLKRRESNHQMITLEQKALQSMMNPHFIFNALGSIQKYFLQNKPKEAGLYLSQFARLIRQNISAINSVMINLEEEIDRLKNYLDLERLRMENKFEYTIEFEEGVEEEELLIPSMIIQPFVENAVWHGISALEDKGMIRISFALHSPQALKITIEDNGIGIKQASVYASKSEDHLNMGITMTRKRLEIIGKNMNVKTSIDTSEISPGSPNPGMRVILIVPFTYNEREIQ